MHPNASTLGSYQASARRSVRFFTMPRPVWPRRLQQPQQPPAAAAASAAIAKSAAAAGTASHAAATRAAARAIANAAEEQTRLLMPWIIKLREERSKIQRRVERSRIQRTWVRLLREDRLNRMMEKQGQLQPLQQEQPQKAEEHISVQTFCTAASSRLEQLQRRSTLQQQVEEHTSLQKFCTAASSRLQHLQQRNTRSRSCTRRLLYSNTEHRG